ncbi:MAG: hydantoinase/oxoprolinase family protein [Firmicutes bacterium]|nr:hydantoinase/oxoprolinase family protein [Bacillota bacterium]
MSLVLGIDTGGTFTDAVIIDLETKEILAEAKSETTHHNLIDGISNVIRALDFDTFDQVRYASLSTTLATNAIVENRGCRVGLLLMGFDPVQALPHCEVRKIPGNVDLHGTITEELDDEVTIAALESLRGKVDAVAVSCILSIRNPELENQAKALVRDVLGLPCIAAHELSAALGMQERTVTAVLNARLLSVIDELLDAVKSALKEKNMDIPVMVVKGDGSLMTETVAKYRPIETILSGPAASIIGASFLNDTENGFILDMGGTTTDIAVMKNGRPRIDDEGARVGGWRTRVAAAEVNTFGLGGDSRIYRDHISRRIKVGPRRVYPVSVAARQYPHYLMELGRIFSDRVGMLRYEPCEGFILLRKGSAGVELSVTQSKVLNVLKDGAHTLYAIGRAIGVDPDFINMDILVEHGIVAMVGFTPTDILHVKGSYLRGDANAAKEALNLIARHWDMNEEEALNTMVQKITDNLSSAILESSLAYEAIPEDAKDSMQWSALVNKGFYGKTGELFSMLFRLNMPIIGIGAPIRSWLDEAAAKFHTDAVYPAHYHVANAVGAAAGKVMTICHISVQNHELDGVYVYAPWGRVTFAKRKEEDVCAEDVTANQMHIGNQLRTNDVSMESAIDYAVEEAKKRIGAEMDADGVTDYTFLVDRKDRKVPYIYNENAMMFIESELEIIAVVDPAWQNKNE